MNDNTVDKASEDKKLVALKEQKFDELFGSKQSVSYLEDDDLRSEVKSNYLNGNVENASSLTEDDSQITDFESWKKYLQEFLSELNKREKKVEVMNAYLETPEVEALKKQFYYYSDLYGQMSCELEEFAKEENQLLNTELMKHLYNIDNLLDLRKNLIETEKVLEKISSTDALPYTERKKCLEKEINELKITLQFSNELKAFEQQQLASIDDPKYQTYFENFVKEERENLSQATPEEYEVQRKGIQKIISNIEACENLQLKDTDTVQNLTKESLKTATQKVDGFMKWGYAKAEDLKNIGGDELVKHANASKIALGIGAVVAGLGTGIVAYTLINKKQPTSQASKST